MRIIVLITDGYGGYGGIAQYNRYLIDGLADHKLIDRLTVIPRIVPEYEEQIPEKVDYHSSAARGGMSYLKVVFQTFFSSYKPSLIICGHIHLLPVAMMLSWFKKIPALLILHGIEGWRRLERPFVDRMLQSVEKIICVSSVTKERFLKWSNLPEERVEVVLNGLDLSKFSLGSKPAYLIKRYNLDGKKVILTVGRLDQTQRAKGFDEVIAVLPGLLQQYPEIVYLIVGDGTDMPRLKEKVQKLGLESCVVFAGRIQEAEKADHYRVADAYVMPSRGEGFGYVYLEALACGLPVVGGSLDGSRDALLGGRLGRLVDPNDLNEVHDGIIGALEQPKIVPDELSIYSIERFQSQIREMVDAMV